jgi:hypothetical protein
MRIMPTRSIVAGSVAAVLIAGLAGCGSSNDNSNQASSPTQPDAGASAAPAASTAPSAAADAAAGDPFLAIRTAAQHMPGSATVLAGGFAKALKLSGDETTDAAKLRAALTNLFTEHVYLAGIAVATAYTKGADSDAFKAASTQVGANATDLETAVTGLVGDANGAKFKSAFDAHITDFVNYAVAAKKKDAKGMSAAVTALTAYAKAVGTFFNSVTGGKLSASAVQQDTMTHILTLKKAVDDLAAGKTAAYNDLKLAADHMAMSADVISKGVAAATKKTGNVDDKASTLQSELTSKLIGHVYLSGVAVFTAYTDPKGAKSDAFAAAAKAVQTNSDEITDIVGAAGATAKKNFKASWDAHVTDFVNYAVADATGDSAGKSKAAAALTAYTQAAGTFLASITGNALPAAAVTSDLATHVSTLEAAIDAFAKALVSGSSSSSSEMSGMSSASPSSGSGQ